MEAISEAKAVLKAGLRNPMAIFGKSGGSAAFGHEENTLGRELESGLKRKDFGEVVFGENDELQKGFLGGG